jgi:hypothetical protein
MRWLRFLPRAKWDRERLRARVLVADRAARRKLSSSTRIREEVCRNTIGFLDSVGRDSNEHSLSARESPPNGPPVNADRAHPDTLLVVQRDRLGGLLHEY